MKFNVKMNQDQHQGMGLNYGQDFYIFKLQNVNVSN